MHNGGMIYGYARVSTDGQSVAVHVAQRRVIRPAMVFREVTSGVKTTTRQRHRALSQLNGPHRNLMLTRRNCRVRHNYLTDPSPAEIRVRVKLCNKNALKSG